MDIEIQMIDLMLIYFILFIGPILIISGLILFVYSKWYRHEYASEEKKAKGRKIKIIALWMSIFGLLETGLVVWFFVDTMMR